MNYWIDMFKNWQDSQEQFLKNLPTELPPFQSQLSEDNPWVLPQLNTFISWGESAVEQSMELQNNWLQQWQDQLSSYNTSSNDTSVEMFERIQDSMQGWSDCQKELWNYWFNITEEIKSTSNNSQELLENLDVWKKTVEESLNNQTQWLDEWSSMACKDSLSTAELQSVSDQLQDTMKGWLDTQNTLWGYWFDYLSLDNREVESATDIVKTVRKNTKTSVKKAAKASQKIAEDINDNLEQISGIGPALAKKLTAQGISSFMQIAELTDKEIEKLEATVIKFPGRIRRDDWIGQAKKLLKDFQK